MSPPRGSPHEIFLPGAACGGQPPQATPGNYRRRGLDIEASQYIFRLYFDDTWKEGDPVGGGPARTEPNKFVPQRGFFTVWRENMPVFEALGYANFPNETGYTMRVQEFAGGLILTGEEGGVRDTYAIFVQRTSNSGAPIVTWSRIFTETVGGAR